MTFLNRRRWALLATLTLLLGYGVTAGPSPAHADDSSTLTVVGTSDVYDSNLVQSVLKPGFEAYETAKGTPVTLNYVSKGTSAAIAYAEAGTASALIVHAPSVENQFVADGWSTSVGKAIFWGDYVLLGPKSDPAGVMANGQHDIVKAFEDVAAAGAAGKAEFVSREDGSGTNVQEHAIWALTSGVPTCAVSNGGGTAPSTDTAPCTDSTKFPSWYQKGATTQAANVLIGNSCNFGGGNDCYVFTDRGTFDYLVSQNEVTNLSVVTRDNDPSAPGGVSALVNSFHAYAINPAKFASSPNVQLNTKAAEEFLTWVTSPAAQQAVGKYLPADKPFVPDAAPTLTTSKPKAKIVKGKTITVKGKVANVVPGTPALSGVTVHLLTVPANKPHNTPHIVKSVKTSKTGAYSITYKPKASQIYTVATGKLTVTEYTYAAPAPAFQDVLQATSTYVGKVTVTKKIKKKR